MYEVMESALREMILGKDEAAQDLLSQLDELERAEIRALLIDTANLIYRMDK